MKLTKTQLKQIIKEELENLLSEDEEGTWIIVKKSRYDQDKNYTEKSGYKRKTYNSKAAADTAAKEETEGNPVGFIVNKLKEI